MKTQCDIVRDLMPLCIDGAASAESTKYVEEHMAECEECKSYYEKMKAVIPKREGTEEGQEQAEFGKAAELMKLKHRIRVRRNVFIGILIGMLAVAGIYIGWQALAVNYNGEIPPDQYSVSLAQLKDGRIIVSVDYLNSKRISRIYAYGDNKYIDKPANSDENPWIFRVTMPTTIIPQYRETEIRNGPILDIEDIDHIDLIVAGRNEDKIIWKRGEAIPQASQAMEDYYQVDDEFSQFFSKSNYRFLSPTAGRYDIEEEQRMINIYNKKLEELRQQVPEWQ